MEKKQDYKRFIIVGAKWFDKVNGNTYCSAKIIDIKNEKTYYVPYQYGYGDYYIEASVDYLIKNKIVDYKIDYQNYTSICVGYISKTKCKNHEYGY